MLAGVECVHTRQRTFPARKAELVARTSVAAHERPEAPPSAPGSQRLVTTLGCKAASLLLELFAKPSWLASKLTNHSQKYDRDNKDYSGLHVFPEYIMGSFK